jgi:hypothetical protein
VRLDSAEAEIELEIVQPRNTWIDVLRFEFSRQIAINLRKKPM